MILVKKEEPKLDLTGDCPVYIIELLNNDEKDNRSVPYIRLSLWRERPDSIHVRIGPTDIYFKDTFLDFDFKTAYDIYDLRKMQDAWEKVCTSTPDIFGKYVSVSKLLTILSDIISLYFPTNWLILLPDK